MNGHQLGSFDTTVIFEGLISVSGELGECIVIAASSYTYTVSYTAFIA